MLDIQDLEGNVLHQCRKDMDVIVSYHQFPKTQTTQNSHGDLCKKIVAYV